MKKLSIDDAIRSESAFKGFFKDIETWRAWVTFLKLLTGCGKLSEAEKGLVRDCSGLSDAPDEVIREVFVIAGRRSGKSSIVALLSVFYAIWGEWDKYLSVGESPKVFIIATNKSQARIVLNYVKGLLDLNEFLRGQVKKMFTESVELHNGVEIIVKPASWRTLRGYTIGLLILEELAYFRFEQESATRDKEVYTALKPSTLTIKNSLIIGISTPHARQGLLWEKFQKHHGKPGPVLIWRAPTWVMNRTLSEKDLEAGHLEALGSPGYGAEYAAKFREDIESYLPIHVIDRAIEEGRGTIPFKAGMEYHAFCDPSEGLHKGGDSMTFGVSHKEVTKEGRNMFFLDALLEFRPPFDPGLVIKDIARTLKEYRVSRITQDRHAIGWIRKDLEEHNIEVEVSDKTKSQIYEFFSVMMSRGIVKMPDIPRLKLQTVGLQRYTKSGGAVKIDHYRSGHDDLINSAAGAVVLAAQAEDLQLGLVYHAGMSQARGTMKKDESPAELEPENEDVGEVFVAGKGESMNQQVADRVRSWGKK